MTSMNDPIRQASLFTTWGLVDPRLMPGYVAKPKEELKQLNSSSPWWMRMTDFLSFGKKAMNA